MSGSQPDVLTASPQPPAKNILPKDIPLCKEKKRKMGRFTPHFSIIINNYLANKNAL